MYACTQILLSWEYAVLLDGVGEGTYPPQLKSERKNSVQEKSS